MNANKFKKANGSLIIDLLTDNNMTSITDEIVSNILTNYNINNTTKKAIIYIIKYKFNYNFTIDSYITRNYLDKKTVTKILNITLNDLLVSIIEKVNINPEYKIDIQNIYTIDSKIKEQHYQYFYEFINLKKYDYIRKILSLYDDYTITDELLDIMDKSLVLDLLCNNNNGNIKFDNDECIYKYIGLLGNKINSDCSDEQLNKNNSIDIQLFFNNKNILIDYKKLYNTLTSNRIKLRNVCNFIKSHQNGLTRDMIMLINLQDEDYRWDFEKVIPFLLINENLTIIKYLDIYTDIISYKYLLNHDMCKKLETDYVSEDGSINMTEFAYDCIIEKNNHYDIKYIDYLVLYIIYTIYHGKNDNNQNLIEFMTNLIEDMEGSYYTDHINKIINIIVDKMNDNDQK